ncbi:MAG: N-acetyl-gamma-glutamyl-phosphate reductase [Endomicrobiaceae bacterium]|nr:N-acetyl-gamma-glutamyl-phosphate reductase [Endomicrobiaceae bacterium]MDD3053727.1 N-acetyl-gamma-glutamyl-phosphate reductase [Endomicrobiaceae bacterium]MDD3922748.1 N-acetyl-gamma-glutamyl-phosphate reductase [Endomicrobiaceae bacterium]
MIRVGIIGITGYTGEELIRILSKHTGVKLTVLAGRAGSQLRDLKDIYPKYADLNLKCEPLNVDKIKNETDVVFLALPHAVAFAVVPLLLKAGKKVIDLSADFRLKDADTYEKWYKVNHTGKEFIKDAVYGLVELNLDKIKEAKLIANPGCYPTTILLGSAPAIKNDLVKSDDIIVDSKSGVSGSGRKNVVKYYETEHPTLRAYNIAGKHRHIPEIEQELSILFNKKVTITFTPQIIPLERGMLSTIYFNLNNVMTTSQIIDVYKNFYKGKNFVRVLDEGILPSIKNVANTNFCEIGLSVDTRTNKLIVVSAIDNLVKGASGQAVQNMNLMFGLDETEGLKEIK